MRILAVLVGASVALAVGPANADENVPESHVHQLAKKENYAPGLGEIMALQQMRHAKLWLAGKEGNWPLAAYELDELREGFDDAKNFHPTLGKIPVGALVESLTPAPLDALGKAIERKDGAGFSKSFDSLTAACNACHRAAQHGFIVITRPGKPTFSNQRFAPERR